MFLINEWLQLYQKAVTESFGARVLFIGLQGSFGRCEATENSDIDVVLILDKVTTDDLDTYKKITAELPHRERLCGFVSGKKELSGWCKHDLFQFFYDTTAIAGSLSELISVPTPEDARLAIQIGACNLYHGCSHNYLHAEDTNVLVALYKAAFFVLQAKHFCASGEYIKSRCALEQTVTGDDLRVLRISNKPSLITADSFREASAKLLVWSGALLG